MEKTQSLANFAEFTLNTQTGEFSVNGNTPALLAEQPLQILVALLERPGELISREELRKRLWPNDTVVEFEHSISAAMNRLRRALGDSSDNPRLIETIARRGYRMKVAVRWESPGATQPKVISSDHSMRAFLKRKAFYFALLAPLLLIVGTFLWIAKKRPADSAKHDWIQKQLTVNSSENPVTGGAISPDGKYLAYTDLRGIHLKALATGESGTIAMPENYQKAMPNWQIGSWLPDSSHFYAIADQLLKPSDLWSVSVAGGLQQKIADDASPWGVSPVDSLLAVTMNHDQEIWLMQSGGENKRKLVSVGAGNRLRAVQWSPDGRHLAYIRNNTIGGENRAQVELIGVEDAVPHVLLAGESVRDVSTLEESYQDMAWLPDGKLILTGGQPDIHGLTCNLWQTEIDQKRARASRPIRITDWSGFCVYNLSSTADGKKMVFGRSSDLLSVYVADFDPNQSRISAPTRLTLTDDLSSPADWSPDGKEVLVRSNRDGGWGIYWQPLNSSAAVPLITGLSSLPYSVSVTPDHEWVLFREPVSGNTGSDRLMRIPFSGGPAEEVLKGTHFQVACAPKGRQSCVIAELSPDRRQLIFRSLDPLHGAGPELASLADPTYEYGWDLSPDGTRVVIYSDLASQFTVLSLNRHETRAIKLAPELHLRSVMWGPDGRSFFAANNTQFGAQLLHIDLRGDSRMMWELPGSNVFLMAKASPDGRKLAIQTSAANANLWMIENF